MNEEDTIRYLVCIIMCVFALSGKVWAVDVWDADPPGAKADNLPSSSNTLFHTGPAQIHDLEAMDGNADVDWFRISPRANRSYEVQVVNITQRGPSTIALPDGVVRTHGVGSPILQDSTPLDGTTNIRTLRWISSADDLERIRITGPTDGIPSTQYTIQFFDTTLFCPRFNNTGSQVSVLIVQATDPMISSTSFQWEAHFYD